MNRLQAEFQRLYLPEPDPDRGDAPGAAPSGLVDAQGRVRALVLELARPADWDTLAPVWQGVQLDLGLPAPAIAVSGVDGIQLWFSLAEAVSASQAQALLAALRLRYLPDVAPHRVVLMPAPDASSPTGAVLHALPVPAQQAATGHWSVFVAPDLAPVFGDTPWLDSPPGDDGQAKVLRGLRSITPAEWVAAVAQCLPVAGRPVTGRRDADTPNANANANANPAAAAVADPPSPGQPAWAVGTDPRQFLLSVMNDPSAALALRIDAAKALLPYSVGPGLPLSAQGDSVAAVLRPISG